MENLEAMSKKVRDAYIEYNEALKLQDYGKIYSAYRHLTQAVRNARRAAASDRREYKRKITKMWEYDRDLNRFMHKCTKVYIGSILGDTVIDFASFELVDV